MRPQFLFCVFCLGFTFRAWAAMGPGEHFKVAKYHYDAGHFEKALPDINKAIEMDTNYAGAYYLRALVQFQLNNVQDCLVDTEKALQRSENEGSAHAEYLLLRARARYALGMQEEALRDANASILMSATNEEAFFVRATIKRSIDDYRGACADLSYAIETFKPGDPEYYAMRARTRQDYYHPSPGESLYAEVLADLGTAIALDTADYDHYKARSAFFLSHGQDDLALADLSLMIENQPRRHEAYMLRGKILMDNYQYKEAIEDFSRAIELQPDEEKMYRFRALCYHNIGSFRSARQDLSHAITILSEKVKAEGSDQHKEIVLAETYIQRGLVTAQIRNASGSCQDFLSARELGVQKGNYYYAKFCNTW